MMISQVSAGNSLSANNEFVEVYNNAEVDVDISNWCISYASSSGSLQSKPRYCFTPADAVTQLFLRSKSYALVTTPNYILPTITIDNVTTQLIADGIFNDPGISMTSGHILLSSSDGVIDTLGWGTAPLAETIASIAPTASLSLQRKMVSGSMQDTNNNLADFLRVAPLFRSSGVYEVRTPIDLCATIEGVQETIPDGYGYDDAGNCELLSSDVCSNLENIQLTIPDGMVSQNGSCIILVDLCLNLEGLQTVLPDGYALRVDECFKPVELKLTELLPNVSGSDTGDEFIEVHNTSLETVDLSLYRLSSGKDLEDHYDFSVGTTIMPGQYRVFYDSETQLTLLNTSSRVSIQFFDGTVVDEVPTYFEPRDDESWALIGSQWAYTDRVTPGLANLPMLIDDDDDKLPVVAGLTACAAGKYRHPITNRCRNIESDTSMLVACDNDEYRNPETNRCRKVVSLASTLVPCSEGYERNALTNRCRKVAGVTTQLAACQPGYERNSTTNRCRKVILAAATAASIPSVSGPATTTTTLIGVAGAGVVGYGLYEWRAELLRGARRFKSLVIKH